MSIALPNAPATRMVVGLAALAIGFALAGCGKTNTPAASSSNGSVPATSEESTGGDEAQPSPDMAGGDLIVLPGTGRYAIGTEAPYGGYQLHGEPDEQPAGCTWSIEDADGVAAFENSGQYAFLTDIKEDVTFVTDGCPDWEQFE